MNKRMLVAAATMLGLAGCSLMGLGERRYEAQRLQIGGSARTLAQLISAYAETQPWVIVSRGDTPSPTVEALSAPVEVSGITMRNRWLFWAKDNQVVVELHLEVRFDPAVDLWESSAFVCDSYEYQHEQRHLQALAELAGTTGPVMVAAAASARSVGQ